LSSLSIDRNINGATSAPAIRQTQKGRTNETFIRPFYSIID